MTVSWITLYSKWGTRCYLCDGPGITRDHVIPRSQGGGDTIRNVRPCCGPCNTYKSGHTLHDYVHSVAFYHRLEKVKKPQRLDIVLKTLEALESLKADAGVV